MRLVGVAVLAVAVSSGMAQSPAEMEGLGCVDGIESFSAAPADSLFWVSSAWHGKSDDEINAAAARGDQEAKLVIARTLVKSADSSDLARGFRAISTLSEGGYARASALLATLYESGKGVERDTQVATELYRVAVSSGVEGAEADLGVRLALDATLPAQFKEARFVLERAAIKGYPSAQHALSVLLSNGPPYIRNFEEALRWAKEAADAGYGPANVTVASLLFAAGDRGAEHQRYALRAFCSHAPGSAGVLAYADMSAGRVDRAMRVALPAAAKGDVAAMEAMAALYADRNLGQFDPEHAIKLAEEAYRLDPRSDFILGAILLRLDDSPSGRQRAKGLLEAAADRGVGVAAFDVAAGWINGTWGEKDDIAARQWLELAASMGHLKAKQTLEAELGERE